MRHRGSRGERSRKKRRREVLIFFLLLFHRLHERKTSGLGINFISIRFLRHFILMETTHFVAASVEGADSSLPAVVFCFLHGAAGRAAGGPLKLANGRAVSCFSCDRQCALPYRGQEAASMRLM